MTLSHRDLCDIGAKWLRNGSYHNCKSVLIDGGSFHERPDVIGFRYRSRPFGSVLLEAKVSRADFLNDKKKAHRLDGKGMGKWRYFICPKDMISLSEVPENWGLIYVSQSGRATVVKGVFENKKTAREIQADYEKYQFPVYDLELESRLLAVNLQGMIYNEDEGLDFKELKKQLGKLQRLQNEHALELSTLKTQLEAAEKNALFYKGETEKANVLLGVKDGEILTLKQNLDVATGRVEI